MNRQPALALVAAAALTALCAGCQSMGGSSDGTKNPPELVAQSRPPIADIPVAIGFSLDEGRSRNFAAGGARYVDHVYTGGSDKFALSRFYKRQMPTSRWVQVTDLFVQGEVRLEYEKETERCSIIIASQKILWLFPHSTVKVQLWTTGRIEPPPEPKKK